MACIMVVCVHVSNYYCRGYGLGGVSDTSYVISVIWNSVSRVAVPIFFMISGALLLNEPVNIRKAMKRMGRVLLTLLLWSGIYYVWNLLYRNRLFDMQKILEEPVKKHLWFLYAIIGIYLVVPFLQSMVQNMSEEMMACFVAIWFAVITMEYILSIVGVNISYPIPLLGGSCYLGYFILGYIIMTRLEKIPLSFATCICGALLALLSVTVLTCVCTWLEGKHVEKLFENRNILVAVGTVSLFCAVLRCKEYSEQTKKMLQFLSKHTFMIYLCHVIFIDIVKLEFTPLTVHAFWGIPIYTIFVFLASLLFSVLWHFLYRKAMEIANIR